MAKAAVLTTKTTNTNARKRKSNGAVDDGKAAALDPSNKRRKTLDTFFSPQVTVTTPGRNQEDARAENVPLNAEQVRVLQMVVQEEKNVFFTGAAGEFGTMPLRYLSTLPRRKRLCGAIVVSMLEVA
ncbi:hypothetical protein BD413DRAFT_38621 [Trametes elegans]|nr:hypothetical protein BD413DRAFT_38621 [Trametes elegans]